MSNNHYRIDRLSLFAGHKSGNVASHSEGCQQTDVAYLRIGNEQLFLDHVRRLHNLAADEDWEAEAWADEWEFTKSNQPKKDQEDLKKLEHTLYEFLETLKHVSMSLNSDGHLDREGHNKIMNLIDEYWHEESAIEDQE